MDPLKVIMLEVCDVPISLKLLSIHGLEIISTFTDDSANSIQAFPTAIKIFDIEFLYCKEHLSNDVIPYVL